MEKIQYKVYDKSGKLKKLIYKSKEKELNEDSWLNGVTCFVINEKGEALIEKRVNKGLTPGKLDLCSGHVDGEETQTQAMIRELKEELGIQLEEAMNVVKITQDAVPLQFKSSGKNKNFFITFYCLKRNNSDIVFQKEEIDKIVWLPIEETFEPSSKVTSFRFSSAENAFSPIAVTILGISTVCSAFPAGVRPFTV